MKRISECGRILREKSRVFWRILSKNRDALGYYAILTIVLLALGTAAYGYRNGAFRRQQEVQTQPTLEPAVQVHSVPLAPTAKPKEEKYMWPLEGEIITAYSGEELLWSDTLGMWQTHLAIDIGAEAGEAVLAAADGTVTEAYYDALYGYVIEIDHGDGCILRYGSMNSLQMIQAGDKVAKGEVIGAAGNCSAEADIGVHLHLEFYHDGSAVDFQSFLAEM